MKTLNFSSLSVTLAILALLARFTNGVAAADSTPAPSAPAAKPAATVQQSAAEPVHLSFGVDDVLKMNRAKVGDNVLIPYIKNSGRLYSLSASEIIYLHNEGVSDEVIRTMLGQSRQSAPPATPNPTTTVATAAPAVQASSPQYVTAPATASSVYVIPSSTSYVYDYGYPYYSYYSSYYPYYGYRYWYPGIALGFSFGNGCYYGGSYYGGHRYYNGGYHGTYYSGYRGSYHGGYSGGGHINTIGRPGGGHVGSSWSGGRSGGSRLGGVTHAGFSSGGFSRGGSGRGHR